MNFAALTLLLTSSGILEPSPSSSGQNASLPIVETKYGFVEGAYNGLTRDGRNFYQFRGIQYAVVEERFKPSVEPTSWNGTKSAKEFEKVCYDTEVHGDENCLFLNVFTPQINVTNSSALLPVLVYIHGGSFQGGAGNNYGPNYLLDQEMVFVTLNYRLGILGFLSTGDKESPGNFGLKDQVMALKWVRDNIANFGGDPSKVTVMGQSAGSASVTYHLVSPMSRGLFRYAIAQSGTFMDPWAFTHKPLRYAKKVADYLNCHDTNTSSAIITCLKSIPATTLSQRQLAKNVTVKFHEDPIAGFGPVIEPVSDEAFLTESPYELLVSGNISKVPLLSGIVKEEGIYLWAAYVLKSDGSKAKADRERLQANWTAVSPGAFYLDEKAPASRLDEITKKVEDFYFNGGFSLDDNSTFLQLAHLYSDRMFVASSVHFMSLYAKHAPVYPYLYTYNKLVGIEFGWEELHRNYSLDATHAAELDMLVSPLFNRVRIDSDFDKTSKNVVKLWVSFADSGIPSATYGSERRFPALNATNGLRQWYRLDSDTELIDNIFARRIAFWESLNLTDTDFINCYC